MAAFWQDVQRNRTPLGMLLGSIVVVEAILLLAPSPIRDSVAEYLGYLTR